MILTNGLRLRFARLGPLLNRIPCRAMEELPSAPQDGTNPASRAGFCILLLLDQAVEPQEASVGRARAPGSTDHMFARNPRSGFGTGPPPRPQLW